MHLNILKKSQFYTYVYMHFNAVEVNSLFNTIMSDFPCPYFPFRLDQGILFLQKINILVTDVLSLFTWPKNSIQQRRNSTKKPGPRNLFSHCRPHTPVIPTKLLPLQSCCYPSLIFGCLLSTASSVLKIILGYGRFLCLDKFSPKSKPDWFRWFSQSFFKLVWTQKLW